MDYETSGLGCHFSGNNTFCPHFSHSYRQEPLRPGTEGPQGPFIPQQAQGPGCWFLRLPPPPPHTQTYFTSVTPDMLLLCQFQIKPVRETFLDALKKRLKKRLFK